MTTTKRIGSFFLALLTIFTLLSSLSISISAATTSKSYVVQLNLSKGTTRSLTDTFDIKGNKLSQKKVTIKGYMMGSSKLNGGSLDRLEELARFTVTVRDANGKKVASYSNLEIGDSFKLPKGNQTYEVTVKSYFKSGYSSKDLADFSTAEGGKYYLKY